MDVRISDWTAIPGRLKIRVGTEPLSMAKTYVWAFHTTNHYGQGATWKWCHVDDSGFPTEGVFGDEAQELLSRLVTAHSVLKLLAPHYRIPFLPIGEENVSG